MIKFHFVWTEKKCQCSYHLFDDDDDDDQVESQ